MTHTLHPEIEEAIDKIKKEYDDYEVGEYDEGDYGYSRWLLRSIQILKDIPLLNDKEPLPESKLLWTDFSKEDDIWCEIYWYVKDNRTVITKVNYVTPYVEEELKQSTPKIEPHIQKIQWMWPYNEMTVVESKINELIDDNMRLWDYINNKD